MAQLKDEFKFTPEQRFEMYCQAYEDIKSGKDQFICISLREQIKCSTPYVKEHMFEIFPELLEVRPK